MRTRFLLLTLFLVGALILTFLTLRVSVESAPRAAPSPHLGAVVASVSIAVDAALEVPITVGAPLHTWESLLGGVIWTASRASAKKQAEAIEWFWDDVLLDIKAPANGFGYRFDTNTFEPNTTEYGYYAHDGTDAQEPTTLDDKFQIFGAPPNVKFIYHVPVPHEGLAQGSARFAWQTPSFYGAELQYLFGKADDASYYASLPLTLDFFDTPPAFNWANLRARRGHPEPYTAEAIIFGQEPYHIEGWSAAAGAEFGARVNEYRAAMRARGVTLPYGIHASQLPPTNRDWFKPLVQALPASDGATFVDLYHHYSFVSNDDWLRSFPVAVRAEGFTDWWLPRDGWRADYSRFLWIIEDTKEAIRDLGASPDAVKIGFGEHGITIASPFRYNDMFGALHWANWLAEIMRYNTQWDSAWVLLGEGFSTALIQLAQGALVKTPAFFVYEMAERFRGLTYLETVAQSPMGSGTDPEGKPFSFPWVVARAFENRCADSLELFVINQHAMLPARLTGLEKWKVDTWKLVRGRSYADGNPLDASGILSVRTETLPTVPETPLLIPPLSVNRIVLIK